MMPATLTDIIIVMIVAVGVTLLFGRYACPLSWDSSSRACS
jgi:hypothetical protein